MNKPLSPAAQAVRDAYNAAPPDHSVAGRATTMSDTLRPPLGLKPRWVAERLRTQEILESMYRYSQASFPIPQDWVDELSDLTERERIRDREKRRLTSSASLGARLARHTPGTAQLQQP